MINTTLEMFRQIMNCHSALKTMHFYYEVYLQNQDDNICIV